jgi:hypothetical protein
MGRWGCQLAICRARARTHAHLVCLCPMALLSRQGRLKALIGTYLEAVERVQSLLAAQGPPPTVGVKVRAGCASGPEALCAAARRALAGSAPPGACRVAVARCAWLWVRTCTPSPVACRAVCACQCLPQWAQSACSFGCGWRAPPPGSLAFCREPLDPGNCCTRDGWQSQVPNPLCVCVWLAGSRWRRGHPSPLPPPPSHSLAFWPMPGDTPVRGANERLQRRFLRAVGAL